MNIKIADPGIYEGVSLGHLKIEQWREDFFFSFEFLGAEYV